MANNDIMSDADVERLFSELKRIDSDKTVDEHGFEAEPNTQNLDEEKALDRWRSRLIDMVRFFKCLFHGRSILGRHRCGKGHV